MQAPVRVAAYPEAVHGHVGEIILRPSERRLPPPVPGLVTIRSLAEVLDRLLRSRLGSPTSRSTEQGLRSRGATIGKGATPFTAMKSSSRFAPAPDRTSDRTSLSPAGVCGAGGSAARSCRTGPATGPRACPPGRSEPAGHRFRRTSVSRPGRGRDRGRPGRERSRAGSCPRLPCRRSVPPDESTARWSSGCRHTGPGSVCDGCRQRTSQASRIEPTSRGPGCGRSLPGERTRELFSRLLGQPGPKTEPERIRPGRPGPRLESWPAPPCP